MKIMYFGLYSKANKNYIHDFVILLYKNILIYHKNEIIYFI